MFVYFNYVEVVGGSLPCFPFNHNIIIKSFVSGMVVVKRSLVGNNMFEYSHNIFIILV